MKKLLLVIGFVTGSFALVLQLYLIISKALEVNEHVLSEVWRYFSYMTIWSNILVTLCFAAQVFTGKVSYFKKPEVQAGAFIYILVVGVAYHFLLAHIWSPTGWQYVADVLLHYAVPIIYCIYWLFFAAKIKLAYSYSILWLVYPFVYFVYALLRGLIVHTYPYPFIDVTALGYPQVLLNSVLLLVVYVLLGVGTVALSRKFKNN
ncbi:MAG: Pr6Pr family membrane protein [Cyclobacteriaceae bacterium]|nr:Pr6Pr family membrane protein [Cyclobacteriaceae bacterium]